MAKGSKAGARHSVSDQQHGNQAMKHMADAGFMLPDSEEAAKSVQSWAVKCYVMGPASYAQAEAWDIYEAAAALQQLTSLISGELGEVETGEDSTRDTAADILDVKQLVGLARGVLKFIDSELTELEKAAGAAVPPPAPEPTAAAVAAEAETTAAKSAAAAPASFDLARFNVHYVKRLNLPYDQQRFADLLAVKMVGRHDMRGYSMLWGSADLVDVETDFFTKRTDFWDATLALPKPLTYEHGQDDATKSVAVIGQIEEYGDDDLGRWYVAQLDRNHAYRKMVGKLIDDRALGSSSDSAPQYVLTTPVKSAAGKAANEITQWPWFATSLTTMPAEPRMLDVGAPFWKTAGLAEVLRRVTEQPQSAVGDQARIEALTRTFDLLALAAS